MAKTAHPSPLLPWMMKLSLVSVKNSRSGGRLHPFPGYHCGSHVEVEEEEADYVYLPYTGKNTNDFKMLPDTKVD
jgi:hypothetical protein